MSGAISLASSEADATSESPQDVFGHMRPLQLVELPVETISRALSFVLRSSHCLQWVGSISHLLHDVSEDYLSWHGASACLVTRDMETMQGKPRHFESLLNMWKCINELFVNFEGAHSGENRLVAKHSWQRLANRCSDVTCLCLRNWYTFENLGLLALIHGFPKLQHLVINNCGLLSSYSSMIPVFEKHPTLISLRATFQPNAVVGADFALAAPRTLIALGFVNIESEQVLALLLSRCHLQHFWLSANSSFRRFRFGLNDSDHQSTTIKEGLSKVRTLSVPSAMEEDACLGIVRYCPSVEVICRMRISTPPFGMGALSQDFEPLVESGGVAIRRRGSDATLESNTALWKPYCLDDAAIPHLKPRKPTKTKEANCKVRWGSFCVSNGGRKLRPLTRQQDHLKAIARELAEAVVQHLAR